MAFLLVGCFEAEPSLPSADELETQLDAEAPQSDVASESQPDGSSGPAPAVNIELLETCRACGTGNLDGVKLCIWADDCNFYVGEGGTFHYSVLVERTEPITTTAAQARRGTASSDPLSFVDYWVTNDQGTQYCACDRGFCAPQESDSITLETGEFDGSFT